MQNKKIPQSFDFVIQDQGLFSLLGLPKKVILELREKHGIYILDNGRINVAGLSQKNMEKVTSSMEEAFSNAK